LYLFYQRKECTFQINVAIYIFTGKNIEIFQNDNDKMSGTLFERLQWLVRSILNTHFFKEIKLKITAEQLKTFNRHNVKRVWNK